MILIKKLFLSLRITTSYVIVCFLEHKCIHYGNYEHIRYSVETKNTQTCGQCMMIEIQPYLKPYLDVVPGVGDLQAGLWRGLDGNHSLLVQGLDAPNILGRRGDTGLEHRNTGGIFFFNIKGLYYYYYYNCCCSCSYNYYVLK